MTPVDRGFLGDVENFCKEHTTLSILTLGFAVVCYAIGNLAGRAVSWIQEAFGTTQKTNKVANEVLKAEGHQSLDSTQVLKNFDIKTPKEKEIEKELASITPLEMFSNVTNYSPKQITDEGGILLTEDSNSQGWSFIGVVAMPQPRIPNTYYLHLSTGREKNVFEKPLIEKLMKESIKSIAEKGIKVVGVAGHSSLNKQTLENFKQWQEEHRI